MSSRVNLKFGCMHRVLNEFNGRFSEVLELITLNGEYHHVIQCRSVPLLQV